jgi:hypothetical protein
MSQARNPDGTSDTRTVGVPNHHEIAEQLSVDAASLHRFVKSHPNPTADVVLNYADGDQQHYESIEAWLDHRKDEIEQRRDLLRDEITADSLNTKGPNSWESWE